MPSGLCESFILKRTNRQTVTSLEQSSLSTARSLENSRAGKGIEPSLSAWEAENEVVDVKI
jgi:hypothetical protein